MSCRVRGVVGGVLAPWATCMQEDYTFIHYPRLRSDRPMATPSSMARRIAAAQMAAAALAQGQAAGTPFLDLTVLLCTSLLKPYIPYLYQKQNETQKWI